MVRAPRGDTRTHLAGQGFRHALAGAHEGVAAAGRDAHVVVQVGVRGGLGAGEALLRHVLAQRRRLGDAARDADALAQRRQVLLPGVRQVAEVHAGELVGVRRPDGCVDGQARARARSSEHARPGAAPQDLSQIGRGHSLTEPRLLGRTASSCIVMPHGHERPRRLSSANCGGGGAARGEHTSLSAQHLRRAHLALPRAATAPRRTHLDVRLDGVKVQRGAAHKAYLQVRLARACMRGTQFTARPTLNFHASPTERPTGWPLSLNSGPGPRQPTPWLVARVRTHPWWTQRRRGRSPWWPAGRGG